MQPGVCAAIRECLRNGPMTCAQLSEFLNVKRKTVYDVLRATLYNEVQEIPDTWPIQFQLLPEKMLPSQPKSRQRHKAAGSGVIAGRRTVPAYVFPTKFRGAW